jgi:hypothetical protein
MVWGLGLGFVCVVFGFPFGLYLNMIWVHDVCLRVGCLVKGLGVCCLGFGVCYMIALSCLWVCLGFAI